MTAADWMPVATFFVVAGVVGGFAFAVYLVGGLVASSVRGVLWLIRRARRSTRTGVRHAAL